MEALLELIGAVAQLGRDRRLELELSRRHDRP
jgi:hypothetical protein